MKDERPSAPVAWIGGATIIGALCALYFAFACTFSSSGPVHYGLVRILWPTSLVVATAGIVILLYGTRERDNSSGDASEFGQTKDCTCQNCGSQNKKVAGKCIWCGADLK